MRSRCILAATRVLVALGLLLRAERPAHEGREGPEPAGVSNANHRVPVERPGKVPRLALERPG